MLKVSIPPKETLCTLFNGEKRVVPITESPYYLAIKQGSPLPILEYHNIAGRRTYEEIMSLLSNVMWTLSMAHTIKQRGFNPEGYGVWPRLRGRLVIDGQRRVAICAALDIKRIEVENDIQSLYRWWSQAFRVGDGWIDIMFPPYDTPLTQDRQLCPNTWEAIKPHMGNLSGKQFLDLGCGPGFYCHRATDAGAIATGIDRDLAIRQHTNADLMQDVVQQAKDTAWLAGYGDDKINYVAFDLNEWQTNRQWDVVIAMRVHYHLRDPNRFLAEVSEHTKDVLVVQCNPAQPFHAAGVEPTKALLEPFWSDLSVVRGHLIICKGKKDGN